MAYPVEKDTVMTNEDETRHSTRLELLRIRRAQKAETYCRVVPSLPPRYMSFGQRTG
jgi:hypothetical protein